MPTSDLTVDRPGGALYDGFKNDLSYTRVTGRLVLPVASGSPVVIQTHQEYGIVERTYAASKRGSPPLTPKAAASETVLSQYHHMPLPEPFTNGHTAGFLYTVAGSYSVLETTPSTPDTGYDYGRHFDRLEPMATEAEKAGYRWGRNELATFPPEAPRLDDPNWVWCQAYTQPSAFFSADI